MFSLLQSFLLTEPKYNALIITLFSCSVLPLLVYDYSYFDQETVLQEHKVIGKMEWSNNRIVVGKDHLNINEIGKIKLDYHNPTTINTF